MSGKKWVGAALVALVLAAVAVWTQPGRAEGGVVFELAVKKGTLVQNDVIVNPGVRVPVVKFKDKDLRQCVDGTADDAFCTRFLENDPGGRFYLFCDSRESWRIATNPQGTDATTLEGNLDPKGGFMIAGTHALSDMRVMIVGKAKLERGSFTPSKLSGTAFYTSPTIQEFGSAKFKSTRRLP